MHIHEPRNALYLFLACLCVQPYSLVKLVVIHLPNSALLSCRHSNEWCCSVRVPGVSRRVRQPRHSQPRHSESPPLHRQHQQQRQLPQHGHRGRPSLPDLPVPGGRQRGLWQHQRRQKERAAAAAEAATSPTGQRALHHGQDAADPQRQHAQLHEGIFVVVHLGGEAGGFQHAAEEAQTEKLPQAPPQIHPRLESTAGGGGEQTVSCSAKLHREQTQRLKAPVTVKLKCQRKKVQEAPKRRRPKCNGSTVAPLHVWMGRPMAALCSAQCFTAVHNFCFHLFCSFKLFIYFNMFPVHVQNEGFFSFYCMLGLLFWQLNKWPVVIVARHFVRGTRLISTLHVPVLFFSD